MAAAAGDGGELADRGRSESGGGDVDVDVDVDAPPLPPTPADAELQNLAQNSSISISPPATASSSPTPSQEPHDIPPALSSPPPHLAPGIGTATGTSTASYSPPTQPQTQTQTQTPQHPHHATGAHHRHHPAPSVPVSTVQQSRPSPQPAVALPARSGVGEEEEEAAEAAGAGQDDTQDRAAETAAAAGSGGGVGRSVPGSSSSTSAGPNTNNTTTVTTTTTTTASTTSAPAPTPAPAPVVAVAAPAHAPHFAAPKSFLRPLRSPPAAATATAIATAAAGDPSSSGVAGPAGPSSPHPATAAATPTAASSAVAAAPARRSFGGGARPDSRGSMGSYSQRSTGGKDGPLDKEQREGLKAIRAFLKVRTSYDVLPLSFRLIVFDTALLVKKSLNILLQNGIVSAPIWDSRTSTFAGLLTTSDYINVIQYYWQNPDAFAQIDQFRLNSLPDIERAIGVQPLETVSIHPDRPLYEACRKMLESKARRIPLVDFDDETQRAMVVSVVTQYRILKFVAVNVKETAMLRKPLREIRLGTYSEPGKELVTASMDTPVMEVIHKLVKRSISSVPIIEKDGSVINVFEAVDVITLIKGGVYDDLNLSVGDALMKRSDDFAGIYTCTLNDRLDAIFDTIRKSRVHRLVVLDDHGKLKGVLTLSDILEYVLLEGEEGEDG